MVKRPPKRPAGADPRRNMNQSDLDQANTVAYPQVARSGSKSDFGMLAIVLAALAIGGVTYFGLTQHKEAPPPPAEKSAPAQMAQEKPAPPMKRIPPPTRPAHYGRSHPSRDIKHDTTTSGGDRVMIVDNSTPAEAAADPKNTKAELAKAAAGNALINGNDQFVSRMTGNVGKASRIENPGQTVPQGAVIPAVLETALNTDLPGYARAIVSRDVRSFDGSTVLIPRGARLIGQYKSGLSSGVTRALVIWTRLIRPDGMSVDLGSPGMDNKGQTGMAGEVSTHFLKRFGAAMLLSVISGVSNLSSGSTIVIGSSSTTSAASDALGADVSISPTIKIPQGTAIQVFVAHDLDFSENE